MDGESGIDGFLDEFWAISMAWAFVDFLVQEEHVIFAGMLLSQLSWVDVIVVELGGCYRG